MLGGAIGFPLGQSLQAYHAWNIESFRAGLWAQLDPHMNWWNMMETTYGAVMGAMLGLGLWLNRKRIRLRNEPDTISMPWPVEWILIAVHLSLLFAVEFRSIRAVDALYDLGLIMGIIPMVAIVSGRFWPFMVVFPITSAIIAFSNLMVEILYGETYHLTPLFLKFHMIIFLLSGLGGDVINNLLNSQHETKINFQSTLLYLLIGIPMGFLLIPSLN